MIRLRAGGALSLLAVASGLAVVAQAQAYRAGPPPGHAGGFGEPSCTACHWAHAAPDPEPGGLAIEAPARYRAGERYRIRVALADPALRAAGFQLTARFADGPAAGTQAGLLEPVDSGVVVVAAGGIAYAGHTAAGTAPVSPGKAAWELTWVAPAAGGDVVFHAAANAANDDASELGDRIHAARAVSSSR